MGFELMTSSLPRMRSTPELHRLNQSGKRGSNSRPSAWKADALPTELLPRKLYLWEVVDSNHRTLRERIYSPPQLPLCEPPKVFKALRLAEPIEGFEPTTPRLQITCSGQLSYIGVSLSLPKGTAKIDIILYSPKLFEKIFSIVWAIPSLSILHAALCAFWVS